MKKLNLCFLMVLTFLFVFCSCTQQASSTIGKNNIVIENKNDNSSFYIDGSLPDIGEFTGKQKRFYKEYTDTFIPSDKYGEILPFVGQSKIYSTNDVEFPVEQLYMSYGFCTKDGTIIMDANKSFEYIYYSETDDGFGYYTAREVNDENPEDFDVFYTSKTYIIPKSGEWVLELGERSWLSGAGGGIFSITEYPKDNPLDPTASVKTLIYDYNKNLILTLEGIESTGILSSGLIRTTRWYDMSVEYHFIDLSGNKVLGPYTAAQDFNEYGYSCVADNSNDHYIIDTSGNRITSTPYSGILIEAGYTDSSKNFTNTVFVATRKDDQKKRDIYSADGKFLGTAEGGSYISLRFPKNGDIYYGYTNYDNKTYSENESVWKKLSTGELFTCLETGTCPLEYYGTNDIYVCKDKDTNSAIIFDCEGKTICKIDDFNSLINVSESLDYLTYSTGTFESYYDEYTQSYISNDTTKLHIYDVKNNEILHTFHSNGYMEFVGNSKYVLATLYSTTDSFGYNNTAFLYDLETKKMVVEKALQVNRFNISGKKYFLVCKNNSNTLYDEEMNVIITTYNE